MRSGFLGRGMGPNAFGGGSGAWYTAGGAPMPLIAYQPKGAASLAASYINLATPGTYDAAPGTVPSFAAATGWTFAAASTQYLATGYTPTGKFSPQALTAIVRVANAAVGAEALGALNASDGGISIIPVRGNNADLIVRNPTILIVAGEKTPTGVISVAGNTAYKNGVALAGTMAASPSAGVGELYVGRSVGTSTNYFTGDILAFALYASVLSAAQVAAVSAAMAAL